MHIIQEMANRYPLHQPQMQPRIDLNLGNSMPSMFPRPQGMWQHLPPHQQLPDEQSEKQREYLKQQQKLRLMTATSTPQAVSADALIENLLGKKETFKPKSSHHGLGPGSAPGNQHMLGNVGNPLQGPGLPPSHLGATIRPAVGYPIPSSAAILPGPSSAANMMGGYGSSVLPPEAKGSFSHVPMMSANKSYAVVSQTDVNVPSRAQFSLNLPTWLTPTSQLLPQVYRQVWKLVEQDKGLVDTNRIFPILLTSGLPTDVLGFIWGLANRKIAGQLTEQELYIALALVALAQSGCTFNNLSVLNLIPQPPIPSLKIPDFESVASISSMDTGGAAALNSGKMKREELNLHSAPPIAALSSAGDDAGFDEFSDFQSATELTSSPSIKEQASAEKPEIQSSTVTTLASNVVTELPTTQKCPSVMVVTSSGHGRGIGSRLANHSLGTPKQKKTKHHHHHHHRNQSQVTTNVAASMDEDFSEFQQASSGDGTGDDMFPKCMAKGAPQGKTYLLKESAIRAEMKLEGNEQTIGGVKDGGVMPVEETRSGFNQIVPREITSLTPEKSKSEGSKQEQHIVLGGQHMVLGIDSKRAVSSPREPKSEGVNLMNIEEDKYSALRNLSLVDQEISPGKPQLLTGREQSPASDDFGDFLSAEPSEGVDDSFADIATREKAPSKNLTEVGVIDVWKTVDSPQTAEFQVDDWGEYKDAPLFDAGSNLSQTFDMTGEKKLGNKSDSSKAETDISAVFMDLNLGSGSDNVWDPKDSDVQKEQTPAFVSLGEPSIDFNVGSSWDFKLKDDSDDHRDADLVASEKVEQSSSFQGFLGKIYRGEDAKNEQYSATVDVLCSSPDQLHGGRSDNFEIDVQTHGGDDDFGEFVGPDTWSEEQKYNTTTKDILFDGHLGPGLKDGLYGDSQSVSSLELPPLALSRHGSVPSLDLKIFPSTTEKNGGNGGNQPWDMSPQGIDHQLSEWQRCLRSCLTLLQSAVETFNSISCGEVLDEVVGSTEGKDYLHNLLEVAGVSHRVECSYKQLGNGGEYKQLDSLLADIDNAWSSLESYYVKADIPVDLELDLPDGSSLVSEAITCCGVCLTDVSSGTKVDSGRNTSQLEYGGHMYHSVCANLWVNCVDSSLPALATGSSSFL